MEKNDDADSLVRSETSFEAGCMWEGGPWRLSTNHECSALGGGDPCKHCFSVRQKVHVRSDGSTYTECVWICPSVVIATNEGGGNSTGMCADCILEALSNTGSDASASSPGPTQGSED
jgi:hypothetical protein